MSNLSFARIMYGTSQEVDSPAYGAAFNFSPALNQNSTRVSGISVNEAQGATVESILHKLWMAFSEKK